MDDLAEQTSSPDPDDLPDGYAVEPVSPHDRAAGCDDAPVRQKPAGPVDGGLDADHGGGSSPPGAAPAAIAPVSSIR
jgi:hypothetical protein